MIDLEPLRSVLSETKLLNRLAGELLVTGKNPHGTLQALRTHALQVVDLSDRMLERTRHAQEWNEWVRAKEAGWTAPPVDSASAIQEPEESGPISAQEAEVVQNEPEFVETTTHKGGPIWATYDAAGPKAAASAKVETDWTAPKLTLEQRILRLLAPGPLKSSEVQDQLASIGYGYNEVSLELGRLADCGELSKQGRTYSLRQRAA